MDVVRGALAGGTMRADRMLHVPVMRHPRNRERARAMVRAARGDEHIRRRERATDEQLKRRDECDDGGAPLEHEENG
jgi:uncharacterized membrane protein YebE (DUF533 family)